MSVRLIITVLCGVGLYASLFMLRKSERARQGHLLEPSVVQTPRARLLFGAPNSAFGVLYYPALAVGIWLPGPLAAGATIAAAGLAAAVSVILAYSLLFKTKMPCPYCWTAHGINWSLVVLLLFLHR